MGLLHKTYIKKHSIDIFLLNKFQAVTDWFQEWFGITNFKIARFFLVSGICSLMVARIVLLSTIKEIYFVTVLGILFDLVWIIIVIDLIRQTKSAEEECLHNPQFTNYLAIQWFLYRVVFLLLLLLRFIPDFSEIYDVTVIVRSVLLKFESMFVVLGFYFASCTPKPYKTSKVKKWLKSFVESVQATVAGVFSPAPELATVRVAKNRRVTQRPILGKGSVIF